MQDKEAIVYIEKYLTNSINFMELEELSEWLEKKENTKLFEEYVHLNYAIDYNLGTYNVNGLKNMLDAKIRIEEQAQGRKVKRLWWVSITSMAAAAVVIFFVFNILKTNHELNIEEEQVVSVTPGSDKAILILENGENVVLEPGKEYNSGSVLSNGESLIYNRTSLANENVIKYNELTIPRGGQFQLQLVDGSKIWLNSESKLRYPVGFDKVDIRRVELLYGEAYFEVAPSHLNDGKPFIVSTENQNVKVIGTAFNIRANLEDDNVYTTLVEGKVNVNNGIVSENILPGEQSTFNIKEGTINVTQVDVNNIISWKLGYFNFDKMTLEEIMKTLSRWYNFEYLFEQEKLKTKIFSGFLKREDDINKLLDYLEKTEIVKFKMKNNVLIITE